tara:strand:+ start:446 stop:1024 length:579 start_codon:yes stop_codon:yes gene_type:complete
MKKFLGIIILNLLILSITSYAEDKRQFKIEGMTLNESLLNHFSKKKIIENEIPLHEDKKFLASLFSGYSLIYDDILVDYKPKDPKYIIQGITGYMSFKNDIEGCYTKQNQIDNKISSMIDYVERIDWGILKYNYGGEGSTYRPITFDLKNGSRVAVDCYYYTDNDMEHNLKVHMNLKELLDYIKLIAEPVSD